MLLIILNHTNLNKKLTKVNINNPKKKKLRQFDGAFSFLEQNVFFMTL